MTVPAESPETALARRDENPYEVQQRLPWSQRDREENALKLARETKVGQVLLTDNSPFFSLATAAGLNPVAMVLELASVVAKKPELADAPRAALIGFMMDAAKLRLTIGRGIYPVLIKGSLEGWVGYMGAKELAMRSGSIRDCWATIVYEGDDFTFAEVPIPQVTRLVRGPNHGNMAKAEQAFATLLYPGGRTRDVLYSRDKIESYMRRNASHAKSDSPWQKSPEEMWKAKAILHAVKDLPRSSPELAHLASMMEREEARAELPAGDPEQPYGAEGE